MADIQSQVTQLAQNFIDRLGVSAGVKVQFDAAGQVYQINLECDNPGVLIGHHGETLAALQLLIGQHLKAQTDQWINLAVNVNDYRQRREQTLQQLIDNTVERVLATSQPHSLPPMPAGERRFVHMHLAEHATVKTESMGDGRARSVVISVKE